MSEESHKAQASKLSTTEKVTGILANIRQRGLKDVLDPDAWRAYSQWSEIEKNGLLLPPEEIISFAQQVVYRMVMCPECANSHKCTVCSCAMPQTMCCAAAKCKMHRWNEMMDPEEWFDFFQKNFEFSIIPKST